MKYLVLAIAYIIGVVAERRIARPWISRLAGVVFYVATSAGLIALGVREYAMLGFQGDGFHYYSALRNLLAGHGFYEGPTFEYLLGNHSYITLLAVAPLVAVFHSPVVLLLLTIASHVVSALLVHRLAARLLAPVDRNRLLPLTMGVLYLLYPTVFGLLFGHQLFQPDYLLAPLLLILVHALADGRTHRVSVCIALIVLTKEEYIVTMPVMLVWALAGFAWVLGQRELLSRRRIVEWLGVYAVAVAVAVITLLKNRSMNELNYAVRDVFRIDQLLDPASWAFMLQELVVWILPLLPLLVLIAARRPRWKTAVFTCLALLAFLPGRSFGNLLIYGGHWWFQYATWSDTVVAPVAFATLIIAWRSIRMPDVDWRVQHAVLLVAVLVSFGLTFHPELNTPWRLVKRAREGSSRGPHQHEAELKSIRVRLDDARPVRARSYAIIPDYTEALFVDRYSHVRLAWWNKTDPVIRSNLAAQATCVIIPKGHDWFTQVPERLQPRMELMIDSELYWVYVNKELDIDSPHPDPLPEGEGADKELDIDSPHPDPLPEGEGADKELDIDSPHPNPLPEGEGEKE